MGCLQAFSCFLPHRRCRYHQRFPFLSQCPAVVYPSPPTPMKASCSACDRRQLDATTAAVERGIWRSAFYCDLGLLHSGGGGAVAVLSHTICTGRPTLRQPQNSLSDPTPPAPSLDASGLRIPRVRSSNALQILISILIHHYILLVTLRSCLDSL
jgi:hypothetical protein